MPERTTAWDRRWRERSSRPPVVVLLAAVGFALTILRPPVPIVVWNATASVPVGLYALTDASNLERGDLVVARLPGPARQLAALRGYLPAHVPVIKRVAAVAGDRVCTRGKTLRIDARSAVDRALFDASGRPLPQWQGCDVLPAGAALLLGDDPGSFDSRYFGPISRSLIIGKARLLWRP